MPFNIFFVVALCLLAFRVSTRTRVGVGGGGELGVMACLTARCRCQTFIHAAEATSFPGQNITISTLTNLCSGTTDTTTLSQQRRSLSSLSLLPAAG
jgi:hypothetical protein